MSAPNLPPSPSLILLEQERLEGSANIILGGSWGLMPGLADAMNGWYERCESILSAYPQLSQSERQTYHKEFFKVIWEKLGSTMAEEYRKSAIQEDELKKDRMEEDKLKKDRIEEAQFMKCYG